MNVNGWNITRLDKNKVEAENDAGNICIIFNMNSDGSWDGRCQNPDEILASYRRLGMEPDATVLAGIMQEAGMALRKFLRKEDDYGR